VKKPFLRRNGGTKVVVRYLWWSIGSGRRPRIGRRAGGALLLTVLTRETCYRGLEGREKRKRRRSVERIEGQRMNSSTTSGRPWRADVKYRAKTVVYSLMASSKAPESNQKKKNLVCFAWGADRETTDVAWRETFCARGVNVKRSVLSLCRGEG